MKVRFGIDKNILNKLVLKSKLGKARDSAVCSIDQNILNTLLEKQNTLRRDHNIQDNTRGIDQDILNTLLEKQNTLRRDHTMQDNTCSIDQNILNKLLELRRDHTIQDNTSLIVEPPAQAYPTCPECNVNTINKRRDGTWYPRCYDCALMAKTETHAQGSSFRCINRNCGLIHYNTFLDGTPKPFCNHCFTNATFQSPENSRENDFSSEDDSLSDF